MEENLVTQLAIILVAAGIFTVISKALKQPLILGYIVAGFLVGPHLGLFPQFSPESVEQWSQIGIIFLLFSLGLEFSFKKLLKVGSSALILAGCIFVGMAFVGLCVGRAMDWSMMESVFLGGMLSMSSTTIIIKTYDDLGLKQKSWAELIFGTLVLEDLLAIVMMVLLSTLAVSNHFAGTEMIMGIAKLVFFLILWFLVGIFLIPTLLKKAHKYLSDEILLIISIGLCFAMVALAMGVGFSSALGAFVMGSILAETIEGERIEHLTIHIKELFGAIFFVSVGMMVDPHVIAAHWGSVLIITLSATIGIAIFAGAGVLISGKGLENAVHTGCSMAQLGEFAFIIAGVGCSLGVMRDFIYPVIISVSVITAFTTPYLIKAGDPLSAFLMRRIPQRILDRINPPQESNANSKAEENEWKNLLKAYVLRVGLYGVLLVAIVMGSRIYLTYLTSHFLPAISDKIRHVIEVGATLLIMSPFLYGLAVVNGSISSPAAKLLRKKRSNRWPILFLVLLRSAIALGFIMVVILDYFDLDGWEVLLISLLGLTAFIAARQSIHKFDRLEARFIRNLNAKDEQRRLQTPVSSTVREKLGEYDVHIGKAVISADSAFIGRHLKEVPFRQETGVNIVKIERGSKSIVIPGPAEPIYPGDTLLAVGTAKQLDAFKEMISESGVSNEQGHDDEDFAVDSITISQDNYLCGKVLKDVYMRSTGTMVISVIRDTRTITNPGADFRFQEGDIVWIAGLKSSIDWYKD
ncbi:MAG: cation:proton antiporter [Bacteroidales bacterium]|nr:cation:proton antiporter [Bacteroidales bacterium]